MIGILVNGGALQAGGYSVDLVEWFFASIAIIVVVTLIYVFVLGKSPPPEGLTEAKLEMQSQGAAAVDVSSLLVEARTALSSGDSKKAVELSVKACGMVLSKIVTLKGADPSDMNVSDMAYIIQSRSPGMPDITQPAYQLNSVHLKVEKGEAVTPQEADWSIATANWFAERASTFTSVQ